MSAKHLVLGLDGADPDLIRAMGRGALPHLFELEDRGVFARLKSVMPAATLPNWSTFLTATDPGTHGVFDFTTRTGYRVAFTGGSNRAVPTLFSRLDAMGKTCACIGFPATWPPEQWTRGAFISGWDSPVAFEADDSFVWPRALHREIQERFGSIRFDDVDEFEADTNGWHERLPHALVARIEHKTQLASWLLDKCEWDAFAFYFGESDTAAHYLWSLHDEGSPRHPTAVGAEDGDGLRSVYKALDHAVGSLIARAGGSNVEVTVVSDHGSGGSSDKVLHLNRALADAGLLTFHSSTWASRVTRLAKETALTRLSPRMRQHVFRLAGNVMPGWLESRARFSAIDMDRTMAFSEELNYFPSVHLNLSGREPKGQVAAADRERVLREVTEALLKLRDPWTGASAVRAVHRREELYQGPLVSRAPDLVLEMNLDRGYSYNLMPSSAQSPPWRRIPASEWLGRKGRSLPGSHRSHGVFFAAGPSVRHGVSIEPTMADASATLLARMKLERAPEMSGRVMSEMLNDTSTRDPLAKAPPGLNKDARNADIARVEARLRALGYVD
ncbi:MAG: alkaline phosphatase family protein [Sandaracinaceae bacterium]|nr:alkaline phosphatase family protein [Sandaracinaceae bacterium]